MARPANLLTLVLVLCGALRAAEAAITIDHQGVGCVVAGKFPAFRAHLSPPEEVSRARIDFHAEGDTHWYFVEMKLVETRFVGVLPQPLKQTTKIHYYIEAIDKSLMESRTAEYEPIVAGAEECGKRGVLVAGVLASAKVAVGASTAGATVAGAPLVPVGFSGAGVVAAGSATGATGAAGVAATGGGGHTGLILAGVGAAGAGVAAAVLNGGPTPTTTPALADQYTLAGDGGVTAQFTVDDFVRLYVNSQRLGDFYGCQTGGMCTAGPVTFSARTGDVLTIEGYDKGGSYTISNVFLYKNNILVRQLIEQFYCNVPTYPCPTPSVNTGQAVLYVKNTYMLP